MQVAFFTDSYFPKIDGVARSVDSFARELTRLGHEVAVFCPKQESIGDFANRLFTRSRTQEGEGVGRDSQKGRQLQKAGQFPVVRFNSFSYYFQPEVKLSLPTPLTSLHKALQPFDVIHSHSPGPLGILAEEVALLRGIPHIHTFHTMLSDYNHYLFQGRLLSPASIEKLAAFWCNRVDFIVAPSFKVKQELLAEGVARPIEIVPTGVDLSRFTPKHPKIPNPSKNFLIEKGLVKQGEFVFLSVSRLGKEKSLDLVLRAFADLVQKIVSTRKSHLRLLIIGDGPERENLMDLSRKLGLTAYVSFAGYIEPELMPAVYQGADVFLFASKTETQGLVVLEAMAVGLPVVAINDGAVAEMVHDGKNGFLVGSAQEMTDKLLLLFSPSTPNPLTTQMSQASRQIAQNFSIQKTTQKMLEYYEEARITYSAKSRRQRLKRQYERLKGKFRQLVEV